MHHSAAQKTLRVYPPPEESSSRPPDAPADALQPTSEWTLLDFYVHHVKPKCLGSKRRKRSASPKTIRQYEYALRRWWEAFTGWTERSLFDPTEMGLDRPEPRLSQLTDDSCEDFLEYASEANYRGETVSDATVKKWCVHLNYCLSRAGPRIGTKKHFARVLAEAPQIEPPELEEGPPKAGYSLDQIWALLEIAKKHARPLPKIQWVPSVWWSSVCLFDYNTAMRPETLFQVRWEHFAQEIAPRVMDIPAEIVKGRRKKQRIWLNNAAWEAIQPFKRPTGLIFGWPWPVAESTLRRELNRLLDLAGIDHNQRDDPGGFYGFRRAFATQCLKMPVAGAVVACQLMMNHKDPALSGLRMALTHYADPVPILQEILPHLPQPGAVKQKRLFE